MKSLTSTPAATGFPLVIPTRTQATTARLVLRNDVGQVVQQWLVKQNKCTLGSSASCGLRCELPGVAPYHALLVVGARQIFIRALAPKLTRDGRQFNELLLTDDHSHFEIAGHRFELTRHTEKPKLPNPRELSVEPAERQRLKFTLARPFELSNRPATPTTETQPSLSSPAGGSGPQTLPPENSKWVAQLVQAAVQPLECQLQNLLEPLAELQSDVRKQQRRRRKRIAAKRRGEQSPDQAAKERTLQQLQERSEAQFSKQVAEIVGKQSASMAALTERISDVNHQLSAIERIIAEEREASATRSEAAPAESAPDLQHSAIEQLQAGIVAVSTALQSLQAKQNEAQADNLGWKQGVQEQLGSLTQSIEQLSTRVADVQESAQQIVASSLRQASVASPVAPPVPSPAPAAESVPEVMDELWSLGAAHGEVALVPVVDEHAPHDTVAVEGVQAEPTQHDAEDSQAEVKALAEPPLTHFAAEQGEVESQSQIDAPDAADIRIEHHRAAAEEQTDASEQVAGEFPETCEAHKASRASEDFGGSYSAELADGANDLSSAIQDTESSSVSEANAWPAAADSEDLTGSFDLSPVDEYETTRTAADEPVNADADSWPTFAEPTLPIEETTVEDSQASLQNFAATTEFDDNPAWNSTTADTHPQTIDDQTTAASEDSADETVAELPGYPPYAETPYAEAPQPAIKEDEVFFGGQFHTAEENAAPLNDQEVASPNAPLPSWWTEEETPADNLYSSDATPNYDSEFDQLTYATDADNDRSAAHQGPAWDTEESESDFPTLADTQSNLPTNYETESSTDETSLTLGLPVSFESLGDEQAAASDWEEADTFPTASRMEAFTAEAMPEEATYDASADVTEEQPDYFRNQHVAADEDDFTSPSASAGWEASAIDPEEQSGEEAASVESEIVNRLAANEASSEEPVGEEDSVEDYMRKLLARMRGGSASEAEAETPVAPVKSAPPRPAPSPVASPAEPRTEKREESRPQAVAVGSATTEAVEPFNPEKYMPRVLAPEKMQNFAAMRELANSSARTAIHRSTRQRHISSVLLKVAIAGVGFTVGSILIAINGLNVNVGLVATVASFLVAAIWGYDAIVTLKPLLQAGLVLKPDATSEEAEEDGVAVPQAAPAAAGKKGSTTPS